MRRAVIVALALFVMVGCRDERSAALQTTSATDRTFEAKVVGIADGDTFRVVRDRNEIRIRIHAIDAPERHQPFASKSRERLSTLLFGRMVSIERVKNDPYGRIVARVMVDGRDAGLEQIRAGFAWHYLHYAREQRPDQRERYAAAEREARGAKRGLWRDAAAVPPWDFRRTNRR